jgi:hypothetical protein
LMITMETRKVGSTVSTSDLHWGGHQFELQPKHLLFRLRIVMVLLCPFAKMWDNSFTGHDHFLLNFSDFIICQSFFNSTSYMLIYWPRS